MSRHTPHRSRAFFVTSTIALSVAFFAVAIGTWLISQGRLDSSANTIVSCTPATQVTDAFESYAVDSGLNGQGGWTVQQLAAGTNPLTGQAGGATISRQAILPNFYYDVDPNATNLVMASGHQRLTHLVRPTQQGEFSFRFFTYSNHTMTVTLANDQGPLMQLKQVQQPDGTATVHGTERPSYHDFSTATDIPFQNTIFSVGQALKMSWNGSTYDVHLGTRKLTDTPIPYGNGSSKPPTKVILDLNSGWINVDDVSYPGGSAVPCITGVSPASGVVGSTATITGSQLDDSLPGQPITLVLNGTEYQTMNNTSSDTSITFTVPQVAPGTYTLAVKNAYGTSQQTTSFTVTAPPPPVDNRPTVTSIAPITGVAGSSAVLAGTNFTATGNRVLLTGPGTLRGVTIIDNLSTVSGSTTALGFTVPAGTGVGTYAVTVDNANGSAAANNVNFTVTAGSTTAAAPTVSYVTPTSGSTLGGTVVGVGGSNFVDGLTVKVGGVAATVSAVISGSITITTPPHAVGAADVTVTNPDGQTATLSNAFTYTDLTSFTLTGIAPSQGIPGQEVTVTGTKLTATGNTVLFTNNTGTETKIENVTASNGALIFAVPINAALGAYTVKVSNSNGTSANSQNFTVVSAVPAPNAETPTLSGIAPASGATGSTVILSGTNFAATGNTVILTNAGGTATNVENVSAINKSNTLVSFTVPANTALGAYSVRIKNSKGTSVTPQAFTVISAITTLSTTPTLTGIAPASGAAGSDVALTGTNFTATGNTALLTASDGKETKVENIGSQPSSTTALVFTVPSSTAVGAYTVKVRNSNGTSTQQVTYTVTAGVAPPTDKTPILTGIAPNQGVAGSLVMLAGINFTAAGNQILLTSSTGSTTTVDNVRLVSGASTFLTFAIPSNAAVGLYSVRVKNDNGTSVTPQAYTVVAAAPTSSTQGGGANVITTTIARAPAFLVSTGGSLAVNLGIAFLMSIVTGYFLLRRRHPGSPQ